MERFRDRCTSIPDDDIDAMHFLDCGWYRMGRYLIRRNTDIVGKGAQVNKVMWAIFALMSMFYLGPGDQTTFEFLLGGL